MGIEKLRRDRKMNPVFGLKAHGSFAELGSNPILGSEANGRFADPDWTPELAGAPPPGFEASIRSGDLPAVCKHSAGGQTRQPALPVTQGPRSRGSAGPTYSQASSSQLRSHPRREQRYGRGGGRDSNRNCSVAHQIRSGRFSTPPSLPSATTRFNNTRQAETSSHVLVGIRTLGRRGYHWPVPLMEHAREDACEDDPEEGVTRSNGFAASGAA